MSKVHACIIGLAVTTIILASFGWLVIDSLVQSNRAEAAVEQQVEVEFTQFRVNEMLVTTFTTPQGDRCYSASHRLACVKGGE